MRRERRVDAPKQPHWLKCRLTARPQCEDGDASGENQRIRTRRPLAYRGASR
jgi:hypothetical protein